MNRIVQRLANLVMYPSPYELAVSRTYSAHLGHHEEMNLEVAVGPASRKHWLVSEHRWLALLASIAGGLLIFFVVLDYTLTPLYYVFAPSYMEEFVGVVGLVASVRWWTLIAVSCAVAVVLFTCWRAGGRAGRLGLVLILSGLVATWTWHLLDRWVDVWGLTSYTESTPRQVQLAIVATIVNEAVDVIAAGLLIAGALLLRRAGRDLKPGNS